MLLQVVVQHWGQRMRNPKVYTIKEFTREPAGGLMFEDRQRGRISVADYFADEYGAHLEYPHLPCARVNRQAAYPVEFCM